MSALIITQTDNQSIPNTEGNNSVAAVPEPHIVNMNAHLRVQWGKNQRHWSTEVWNQVIWTDESFHTVFWTRRRLCVEQTGLNA